MKKNNPVKIYRCFFDFCFISFSITTVHFIFRHILRIFISSEGTDEIKNGIFIWAKLLTYMVVCTFMIICYRDFILFELMKVAENPIEFFFGFIFSVPMVLGGIKFNRFLLKLESIKKIFRATEHQLMVLESQKYHPIKHIISVCILGPLLEEIASRYLLYINLKKTILAYEYISENIVLRCISSILLALISSLIFGFKHINLWKENFIQILPHFISGLKYIIIYEVTGFFFLVVIAHTLHNSYFFYYSYAKFKNLKLS